MKLRQLEALRAVVASGTTTQAADLLGLTQSAVSRLITQLESELGLNIFDRRHGRLRITPEGQHFYDVVKKLLSGIDQITATARDIRTLKTGALRIIAMPALAYGLLPQTITTINKRFRQIKISVEMGTRLDVEEGVESTQFDFGIATLPINRQGIEVEPLFTADGVCVLPMGHELAKKSEIVAEDLADLPFISMNSGSLLRYQTDELFGRLGIHRVLSVEAPSTLLATNLVAKGLGVSIVHSFIASAYGDRVIAKPFTPTIRYEYGLLFPAAQTRSQITNAFVESLRDDLKKT
ncbi:MAG TPA: LysR family transcriptional regulator [Rhodospirillales bacterium]|jgi:DNA-binding transcriptional LysR family regulator|nr:LysR family transcriptional regulator [Rhodospirillales bacterium]